VVQFEAVFHKEADEYGPAFSVDEGTLGEVASVNPGVPGVIVRVHGTSATDQLVTDDGEVFVKPDEVILIVDSRDPRISSNRTEKEAKLAGMDIGLWDVVRAGLPAVTSGNFVDRAKATAALVTWARRLLHGEDDSAAHVASKVYAAIDAIDEMSDEEWATELAQQAGGISLS
jgi:hypothetical protein